MSSEYGWTDEQIGELPLARFRQISSAIQIRRFSSGREENSRISWLARTISTYIAAGYMVGEGKENKALKHAGQLAYDDIESLMLGNAPAASGGNSAQAENKPGSYERFMMMDSQLQKRGKML